jgi:aspartate 1-decarboxylase
MTLASWNDNMRIKILKSKVHRATVTDTNVDYTGSMGMDEDLMDAAGLVPYEHILVADVDNGTRHETYVVPTPRGQGDICVMGAAAHLVNLGDKVIVMAFADLHPDEVANHKPKVVVVDEENKPLAKQPAMVTE